MSIFRAVAFVLFVIGAVLAAIAGGFAEPAFYISAGLAALTLVGASFDQRVG